MILFFCLLLYACSKNYVETDIVTQKVDDNAFLAIELALQEFAIITSELENCESNTTTMIRSDNPNNTVIEFVYTSDNGNGVYGFEYTKNDEGNYELVQQGDYVTTNNILTLISMKDELQDAYLNCLKYLSNTSFDRKAHLNTTIVSVSDLTKELYDSVLLHDDSKETLDKNSDYLVFKIGESSGHDFTMLVCDSETNDVVGYIPID